MSTEKEYIAELVGLFTQEESLKEEIKGVKDSIKESGSDPMLLAAVAKAIVKNKVDELQEKSESTIKLIDIARS